MKIEIEITDEEWTLLAALASDVTETKTDDIATSVNNVVAHLVGAAADGVRRPGSWERNWLYSAFGDSWLENLPKEDR